MKLQVGEALLYLHNDIQLLHRDIKPANIFLRANGDAVLGDFGRCKLLRIGSRINKSPNPFTLNPNANARYVQAAACWAAHQPDSEVHYRESKRDSTRPKHKK